MNKAKLLIVILVIFLLGDWTYSFFEYYYIPLDGDLTAGVVPSSDVQQVLDDPFGFHLLISGEKHVNPNRFFAHFFFKEYMQKVPIWLQNLTDPITSVYLSCALIKILIHILFIFILSALLSGTKNILDEKFVIVAALIVPFIQANGYWSHMGINDRATTYTFFYALPVVLLLIYLMPLYRIVFNHEVKNLGPFKSIFLFIAAIILPLSGPLIPGIALILSGMVGFHYLLNNGHTNKPFSVKNMIYALQKIPSQVFIILIPICLISLYSLFLGLFDSNYTSETIPILDRYIKLPLGIYYQISQSLGVPLLLIIIGVNVYLIKRYFSSPEGMKIVGSLKWIGIFAVVYLLLLPLGGYRPYRPNILRYDTFIPITIALLYFYGISTFFLLRHMTSRSLNVYLSVFFIFCAIYMNSDRIETEEYHSERKCLEILANSHAEVTKLPASCNVMSWEPIKDPKFSKNNTVMLKFWGITKEEKIYYQSSEQN
ncbi:MAG: hypothetical protein PHP53_17920 [Prolixibacteraceae bacterium]|nr:hypothetical protein [Prolixibacteraceae bacterium]